MDRRDITFYDLYKLQYPDEAVNLLSAHHYPIKGVLAASAADPKKDKEENEENNDEIEEDKDNIYGDIEVDDFNTLFKNPNIIQDRFGESLTIKVKFSKKHGST